MGRTLALALLGLSFVVACGAPVATGQPVTGNGHAHAHDPGDHNHDRGHMMIASDGRVDALLTAHLSSKTGHELDIFVERTGAPLALGSTRIRAIAVAAGAERTLDFACAPSDERPADEADGTCSHFVATAAWLEPGAPMKVEAQLPLRRGDVAYVWRDFEPARYAHHVE